jgi:hypothetical protein
VGDAFGGHLLDQLVQRHGAYAELRLVRAGLGQQAIHQAAHAADRPFHHVQVHLRVRLRPGGQALAEKLQVGGEGGQR